jgi:hypothetical protein
VSTLVFGNLTTTNAVEGERRPYNCPSLESLDERCARPCIAHDRKDTVEKLTLFNVCDVRECCMGEETHMRYVCK